MLHVFAEDASNLTATELNQRLNENTSLGQYAEMMYSAETIRGFMLLLQNVLSGFLLAFAALLLVVALVVLANVIRSTLSQERANLAILKTVGCGGQTLRSVYILTFCLPVLAGILAGDALVWPAAVLASRLAMTSIGLLVPAVPPFLPLFGIGFAVLCAAAGFVFCSTRGVLRVRPLEAIRAQNSGEKSLKFRNKLSDKFLLLSLAVR